MPGLIPASVLLLAADGELPPSERVWGTGGWTPPECRETLDWLGLLRFMGWSVQIERINDLPDLERISPEVHCIILGCAPEAIGEETVSWLRSIVDVQPVLVINRACTLDSVGARLAGVARTSECVRGRRISWTGPGGREGWACRSDFESRQLVLGGATSSWAQLDGATIIAVQEVGLGIIATLGFHPSCARDANGAATVLLTHLLTRGAVKPVAWLDFQNTMILRMDDPGGAQNIHSANWRYPKLGEAEWNEIVTGLARFDARLSVGYVGGWTDDGDEQRGELRVAGEAVPRFAGRIYPSPVVEYRDRSGLNPGTIQDYRSEYRGIQRLRNRGLGDVELHGYTHIHPDLSAWSEASDQYSAIRWYREFGASASRLLSRRPLDEHPLAKGVELLDHYFRVRPTTLICPGDEWTNETMGRALDLNFQMVSSYYLAVRFGPRFCWATHVCAPYLDTPDAAWLDAGLPVVGYFHDREPALEGTQWMSKWLQRWREVGAERFLDFRELAAAIACHLSMSDAGDLLRVETVEDPALAPIRAIPLLISTAPRPLPAQVAVQQQGSTRPLPVEVLGNGLGRVLLSGVGRPADTF